MGLTVAQVRAIVSRCPDNTNPVIELREMGMLARRAGDPFLTELGEKLENLAERCGSTFGELIEEAVQEAVERREDEITKEEATPTCMAERLIALLWDASSKGGTPARLRYEVEKAGCLPGFVEKLAPATLLKLAPIVIGYLTLAPGDELGELKRGQPFYF